MDLIKLNLKNFMSYKAENLDFEKREGLYGVIGRNSLDVDEDEGNGAGKTSLFNAVPFSFYGRVRGEFDSDLVNEDYIFIDENNERKDKATVEVVFKHMEKYHKVVRTISKKGNQTLQFFGAPRYTGDKTKWTPLTLKAGVNKRTGKRESGIVRTQQRIADVLGCNDELFINSVYFEQSNIDTFARGTLSEKDNVIKSAAGGERWSDYGLMMASDLKESEKEMAKYDTLLGEEGSPEEIAEEITKQKEMLQGRTHEFDAQKAKHTEKKKEVNKARTDLIKAEERAKSTDELTKQRVEVEGLLRETEEACGRTETEQVDMQSQIKASEDSIVESNKAVKELSAEKKKLTESIVGHTHEQLHSPRLDEISRRTGELEALVGTHKAAAAKMERAEAGCKRLRDVIKGRKEDELPPLQDSVKAITESMGMLEGQLKEIARKGKSVDGSACAFNSLCGFEPTEADKEKIKADLRAEYTKILLEQKKGVKVKAATEQQIKEIEQDLYHQAEYQKYSEELQEAANAVSQLEVQTKELEELKEEADEINASFDKVREDLQKQKELADLENRFDVMQREVGSASKDHERFMKERDAIAARLDTLKKERARYEEQYSKLDEKLKAPTDNIAELRANAAVVEDERRLIEAEVETINTAVQEIKAYIKTLEKSAEKVSSHQANMSELQEKIAVIKYSLEMVRKDIPHLLISRIVPELRDYMRDFIYRISNGRMDCDIRMDRDLKNDTKTHAFDIWLYKDGKTFKYAQTSGGDRARADIAIHLAYICLIASRSNSRFETLFLDEVGAALDKSGVRRFVEIIQELMGEYGFKKVFNITQNRDMMKLIDNRMLITMTSDGSKVAMQ